MSETTSTSQQPKVWFITGTSTGFGHLLAEHLLIAGHNVVATARQPKQLDDFTKKYAANSLVLGLDVTDAKQVDNAVKDTLARFGRIDVLVNNAGYGMAGGIEEATEAEFMPMFETNVFGLIRMTKAWLPYFRQQRSGNIVNLSSIAGLIGSPGWGYYNTTKFAVEGFSEALAAEMAPLGVHVTVVEPGPFRTDFLGRSGQEASVVIPDYADTVGKTRAYQTSENGKQAGDPQKAIEAIITAVEAANPPKHLLLGKLAITRFRTKLEQWKEELNTWESTTLGADFAETSDPR